MAIVNELISPVKVFDRTTGEEIKPNKEIQKAYIVLAYLYDNDEEVRTFDIVRGRDNVVDTIVSNYIMQYDICDLFESAIISETVTPKNSVSFYSFIRFCLERNYLSEMTLKLMEETIGVNDLESWNAYIDEEYYDFAQSKGIESLDKFYNEDWEKKEVSIGEDE